MAKEKKGNGCPAHERPSDIFETIVAYSDERGTKQEVYFCLKPPFWWAVGTSFPTEAKINGPEKA